MTIVLFCHSILSCWNHGNAHFLRGVCRALIRAGHRVTVYEPASGWSRTNALADGGRAVIDEACELVPGLTIREYELSTFDAAEALEGASLVIVHEWTDPATVAAIGAERRRSRGMTLLFHDTHHRAISAKHEIEALDLEAYDGVLAFGEALRLVYATMGWGARAFTWHEAADIELFEPYPQHDACDDVIFIGNWGDAERTAELEAYLVAPVARLGLAGVVHGVRYPPEALAKLGAAGFSYRGWLPNHRVPAAFAQAAATIHVPRRPYVEMLPGIPTIRMFEALACGIPLISAPWHDAEGLFPEGSYMKAAATGDVEAALIALRADAALRRETIARGLTAIRARHTCAHRADELLAIVSRISQTVGPVSAPATRSKSAIALQAEGARG